MDTTGKVHMKHRFMVVDGRVVMSGSLDWTYAAVEQGNVNVVSSKNRELCDDFTLEFDRVWETIFQERFPAPAGCWGCKATTLFLAPSTCKHADSVLFSLGTCHCHVTFSQFFHAFLLHLHGWFMWALQTDCACHAKACLVHTVHMPKPVITFVFKVLRSGLRRIFHCDNVRVQSATQCTASAQTSHMPKPVIVFVLKVLRNGLLGHILYYTCPNL